MNKDIKDRWIAALRSGQYKQTQNTLCQNGSYCCLGVLCDLHSHDTDTPWVQDTDKVLTYLDNTGGLPDKVIRWAGLPRSSSSVLLPNFATGTDPITLAKLNDTGYSFGEIADIIEKHL